MRSSERSYDVAFTDGTGAAAGGEPGCTAAVLVEDHSETGRVRLTCTRRETHGRKVGS